MDDPNLEPPPSEQPPYPPHPPPSMPPSMPSVVVPIPQQPMFSNPDETVEQVMQPVADEESSSEELHLTQPERLELKQKEVSHDSDEKPPKAKAKVQIKKQKVQLPDIQNRRKMKKMMNHIRTPQVRMIRRLLCRKSNMFSGGYMVRLTLKHQWTRHARMHM